MSNIIKAIQEIYPNINGGFVYWETKSDGTAWEKPEDGLVWENKEHSKPSWEAIEANFIKIDLENSKDSKIETCRNYLNGTDWYSSRNHDTGSDYPEDVRENRAFARASVKEITALTTIEEVKAFDISKL